MPVTDGIPLRGADTEAKKLSENHHGYWLRLFD